MLAVWKLVLWYIEVWQNLLTINLNCLLLTIFCFTAYFFCQFDSSNLIAFLLKHVLTEHFTIPLAGCNTVSCNGDFTWWQRRQGDRFADRKRWNAFNTKAGGSLLFPRILFNLFSREWCIYITLVLLSCNWGSVTIFLK